MISFEKYLLFSLPVMLWFALMYYTPPAQNWPAVHDGRLDLYNGQTEPRTGHNSRN